MRAFIKACCGALFLGVFLSGCNSASIPGIQSYAFNVQNNHLFADFVTTSISITAGATIPIPNLTGATIGVNPYLPTDGTHTPGIIFDFDIDLTQLKGSDFGVAGLPDGRAIPDVSGGELPRWSFTVEGLEIYMYLADGAFGIFVPLDLSADGVSLPSMVSQEIDDADGNLLGQVYAIPADGPGTSSGLLILLPFINNSSSSSGQTISSMN